MNKNKCLYLLCFILFLGGCDKEKCISVLDKKGLPVVNGKVFFSSFKERHNSSLVDEGAKSYPFYRKEMGATDDGGRVCFSNHVESDSRFFYTAFRRWEVSKDGSYHYYESFQSIPNSVVLIEIIGARVTVNFPDSGIRTK